MVPRWWFGIAVVLGGFFVVTGPGNVPNMGIVIVGELPFVRTSGPWAPLGNLEQPMIPM